MSDPSVDAERWSAVENATELLRDGEVDAAVSELRAALDRDPRNPYAHFFLGVAHFDRSDYEAARSDYAAAIEHAPGYLGAHVGLGHALRRLGRLEEATRAGLTALSVAQARGTSTGASAGARARVTATATAGAGAGATLVTAGEDPDVHHLLGMVYADRGDAVRAKRHFEIVLATRPEVELEYEIRALIDALDGKLNEAGGRS